MVPSRDPITEPGMITGRPARRAFTRDHVLSNNRRSGAITPVSRREPITTGHARSRSTHSRMSGDHASVHAGHAPSVTKPTTPYKGWVSDTADGGEAGGLP